MIYSRRDWDIIQYFEIFRNMLYLSITMYDYIYFDLDDTLLQHNPTTGQYEVIKRGYENYLYLTEKHYKASIRLVTNRVRSEIKYPDIFTFDDVAGKD
ncbi:hypothetical protein GX888_02950, partial [Candidatus Dojkabacteria bacterium]|nr:hypothetical protein [Candidatus Dojkabacteria bacterium]